MITTHNEIEVAITVDVPCGTDGSTKLSWIWHSGRISDDWIWITRDDRSWCFGLKPARDSLQKQMQFRVVAPTEVVVAIVANHQAWLARTQKVPRRRRA